MDSDQPQPQPQPQPNYQPTMNLPPTAKNRAFLDRIAKRVKNSEARKAESGTADQAQAQGQGQGQVQCRPPSDAAVAKRQAEGRVAAGLSLPGYADMRFETYDPKTPYQSRALRASMAFARLLPKDSPVRGLCFYSPETRVGVGKTHLALAIAHHCFERNLKVCVTTHSDLVERMYSAAHGRLTDETVESVCRRLTRFDLVIVDDFGRKEMPATGMAAEQFLWLCDKWVVLKCNLVFTTNLHPKLWDERYGPPTASRLQQMFGGPVAHIPVDGPNGRHENDTLRELLLLAEQMTLTERPK